MITKKTSSVSDIIDSAKLSKFQIHVLIMCAAVAAADGFDTGAIGYAAPSMGAEWGLQRPQLVPAFGVGLIGMMLGNLLLGFLADKLGRRNVLIASVAIFGIGSILSGMATNIEQIVWLRLLTGIGLGGAMPICLTLATEYSPARLRMILVTLSWMGFTGGLALGGVVASWLIPALGWRALFYLGGVFPLFLCLLLWRALPESLTFLALRPERRNELLATLSCISPSAQLDAVPTAVPAAGTAPKSPIAGLFAPGYRSATLFLWITFFCSLLVFYLLTNWLPTLLSSADLSIENASRINAMLPLGGSLGSLAIAFAMTRVNPLALLAVSYLLGCMALAVAGYSAGYWMQSIWAIMLLVFAAGFFWIGGQNGINLLAASIYPTRMRATGVGWALGMGRAGAIVGSVSGAAIYTAAGSTEGVLLAAAVPLAVGGTSLLALLLVRGTSLPGNGYARVVGDHSQKSVFVAPADGASAPHRSPG